jgi:archaellum biogenesis protein FlaJ (TadC family)
MMGQSKTIGEIIGEKSKKISEIRKNKKAFRISPRNASATSSLK